MVPIDHFDAAAVRCPTQAALIEIQLGGAGEVIVTYGELVTLSYRLGAFLARFAEYDVPVPVAIYSPNDHRVMLAMLGIMRAGGVVVPLHAGSDLETSTHFLAETQPKVLFYHSSLESRVTRLRSMVGSLKACVCLDLDSGDDASFRQILANATDWMPQWIDCSGNRTRPMYYWATSGSTGRPKAVVEDCGNFDVMLRASRARRDPTRPVGTTMSLAPMSHGGGPSAFATLTLGGTVLVLRDFDACEVLERIQRYAVTELWLSPTALTLLLDYPDLSRFDVSSLRCVLLGTAAISGEKLKRAVEAFGPCIAHSYGQIETSFVTFFDGPSVADAVAGAHPERLASSGRSMGVNRVGLMSEDGDLLPSGQTGEIVVRGPCVKRYLDPELTEWTRRFGWHHTGDIGYLDGDGYLYVTGRLKDVVNVAGFKVAAAEVERTIEELEAVQECAVVSARDAIRGEVIRAVLTVRPGHDLNAEQVIAHCRRRLGGSKAPSIVEQWTAIPRSAAGKKDKALIRASCPPAAGAGAEGT